MNAQDQTRDVVAALKEKTDVAATKFHSGEEKRTVIQLQDAVSVLSRKAAAGANKDYLVTLEFDRKAIEEAVANPNSADAAPARDQILHGSGNEHITGFSLRHNPCTDVDRDAAHIVVH